MPLMLSCDRSEGVVGLVRAEVCGYDWAPALQVLNEPNTVYYDQLLTSSLWRRSKILHNDCAHVSGVDVVVVGHTPVEHIQALGNVVYLDTGVGYSEFEQTVHLTLAHTLFDIAAQGRVKQ